VTATELTRRRRPARRPQHGHRLAGETRPRYQGTQRDERAHPGPGGGAADGQALREALAVAVAALTSTAIDELEDQAIRAELTAVEDARRRLDARACRLAAALTDRQRRRALQAHPDQPHAARQAERRTRDELQHQLRWTPTQAKRAQQLGSGLAHSPQSGRAFDAGELPPATRSC
jgi:hypothetical protein